MTIYVQDDHQVASSESWGRIFGACTEKIREASGRSLEQVARLSGMETSEWMSIEAGFVPEPSQLQPMSDALGIRRYKIHMLAALCLGAWE
jgi:transcriptional regulator with XRE-family HTH domain